MSWNLPRTNYQQRQAFYKDVESLILPGFLTHNVKIGHMVLTLRTLYPSDFFMLEQRTSFVKTDYEWRVWFVASCVWMVNGVNLLEESHASHRIHKTLSKIPKSSLDVLFYLAVGLINRTHTALEGTESFCYESTSRLLWKQNNRVLPNAAQISGVPGVSQLGLNSIQKMWVSFNITEDERVSDQINWSNAKFIASASAPQGVEKVNKKDDNRNRNEEERRADVCDFYFYNRLGLLKEEDQDHRSAARGMQYAATVDELEDEMRRWVTGEQDQHDMMVEEYKNEIRRRMEEERIAKEIAWEEARLAAQDEGEYMPPIPMQLVGLTHDEVLEIVAQRRGGVKAGAKFVHQHDSPVRHKLFDKYLDVHESSGLLQVEGNEIKEKKSPSLGQQVLERDLILDVGDD